MKVTIKHWSKAQRYGSMDFAWSRYYVSDSDGNDYGFIYVRRAWNEDVRLRFSSVEYFELSGDEIVLEKVLENAFKARVDYLKGDFDADKNDAIAMGLSLLSSNSKVAGGTAKDKKIAEERRERFTEIDA